MPCIQERLLFRQRYPRRVEVEKVVPATVVLPMLE